MLLQQIIECFGDVKCLLGVLVVFDLKNYEINIIILAFANFSFDLIHSVKEVLAIHALLDLVVILSVFSFLFEHLGFFAFEVSSLEFHEDLPSVFLILQLFILILQKLFFLFQCFQLFVYLSHTGFISGQTLAFLHRCLQF